MPLSKQLFPLQFGQGIDTKTDAKLVAPGKLLELENGVFTKVGSIRKRNGFDVIATAIVDGTSVSRSDGLAVFRDELLMFGDAGRVYSRSEALDGWVDRGSIVSVDLTTDPIVRNTYQQTDPSSATSGGITLTAWVDSRGGIRYSARDDATGTMFVADGEINASSTSNRPRVVVWQSEFVVFYQSANNILYRRVPVASPSTVGVEVNPVSTIDPATPEYDVIAGSSNLFVVGNDSGTGLNHWAISSAWAVAAGVVLDGDPADGLALWLGSNGSDVFYARTVSSRQDIGVFGASGTVLVAATNVANSGALTFMSGVALSADEGVLFAGYSDGTVSVRYHIGGSVISADTAVVMALSVQPCAAAFTYNDAAYCPVSWDSTLQSVCLVMGESGGVIAKTTPGLGGGHRASGVANTHAASGVFSFASTVTTAIVSDAGTLFGRTGIERVSVDFTSSYRYASAEIGGNLLIAGGALQAFDGRTICESGFHFFPEGVTGAVSAGGSLSAGDYQWRVVYEWTDALGQVHRSAPSAAVEKTVLLSDRVQLSIPTLRVTAKDDVRIVVYRTAVNGTAFYRVSSLTSPLENDPVGMSVNYIDTASDASITTNELIYTDGTANQELENIAPGACSLITTHRGRAFVKTGPNRVSYSKVAFDGDPPAFNDSLYILPDGRGGDITALAGMDDKLVIFKERAVFVVLGDGPSNTGAGDYAEPQLVTSDVGCDEPRSVVATNAGLMFHSPKGIYLLDRSLSVTYVGAPVELFNGLTITSAQVVPSSNQVRFTTSGTVTLENGETRTDLVLVYDYLMNQWATFTGIAAVDATVWHGVYVWCKSNGRAYEEDTTSNTDAGAFIQLRFVTSWISLAQLNGFQRIYRLLILGDYEGSHSLRVRLGYDFTPEYTYDVSVNATSVTGPGAWGGEATWGSGSVWGGAYPLELFRVSPARQKCSAIRICIEDTQTSDYGEGFAITGIGILAGVKSGTNKMAAGRSI